MLSIWTSLNFPFGKELTHYRRQNFRLVKIKTNCRQHFKVHLKWKISTIEGRKHCEKRRNCLLQAISLLLKCFPQLYTFSVSKHGFVL